MVFTYTVDATDESGPDGVAVGDLDSVANVIELNGGSITIRSSGEAFPLDFTALSHDNEHLVNWARPRLVQAATSKDGKRVRLTFSEDLSGTAIPPTSLFTIKVNGVEVELTGIAIDAAIVGANQPVISDTWTVDAPAQVTQSWAFTPAGLNVGDEFRLLFLTSTGRDATSTDIDVYNTFVQTAAAAGHGQHPELQPRLPRRRQHGRRRRPRQHRDDGHGRRHLLARREQACRQQRRLLRRDLGRRGKPHRRVRRGEFRAHEADSRLDRERRLRNRLHRSHSW